MMKMGKMLSRHVHVGILSQWIHPVQMMKIGYLLSRQVHVEILSQWIYPVHNEFILFRLIFERICIRTTYNMMKGWASSFSTFSYIHF